MTGVRSSESPIPIPAGKKVYMNHDENWNVNEDLWNLYQHIMITGSLNHAAQLRPELMFSAPLLSRIMSYPKPEIFNLARQVIKFIIGSLDLKITYRPDHLCDANFETSNEMMFTDPDWATLVDTQCSHGCYVINYLPGKWPK